MNALYEIGFEDPRVQSAIKAIKAMQPNYPLDVVCEDIPSFMITQPGWITHTVTFSHGEIRYTAIAGALALIPAVSINEMKAIGLLPKG